MKTNILEQRERKFIDWFINSNKNLKLDWVAPLGSYDRNDFTFYSGRTLNMAEVKIRDFEIEKYETAIIETEKVTALLNLFTETSTLDHNAKLYYIAVYPKSRKYILFDLVNTPTKYSKEWCPKSTLNNNGEYIWKWCNNYKIEDGIIINF